MKTIIELARESGATPYTNRYLPDRPFHTFSPEQLQHFAALIREAVIAELAAGSGEPVATKWIHPSGRIRTTTPDSITDCDAAWQVKDRLFTESQIAGAVLRERERCAKVCEAERYMDGTTREDARYNNACGNCAAAIRGQT